MRERQEISLTKIEIFADLMCKYNFIRSSLKREEVKAQNEFLDGKDYNKQCRLSREITNLWGF